MRTDAVPRLFFRRLREALLRGAMSTAFACAIGLSATVAADDVRAEICKYIDTEGNTHYSNLAPERGWRKLSCTSGDDSSPRGSGSGTAVRAASPPNFPKVDSQTQRSRDDVRRKVLADELAAEEKLLAESRIQYAEGAPAALPEERADTERYRTRIARLRQSVSVHEKNVEALKKELATVK